MFSDFLMTEYGLISIFKVRIMYGLKTAKILVRVCDGVRVTFKIEVRVRNPYPYPYSWVCTKLLSLGGDFAQSVCGAIGEPSSTTVLLVTEGRVFDINERNSFSSNSQSAVDIS